MERRYKSEALEALHEMMTGFHLSGAIDRQTMDEFDADCLVPVERSGGPSLENDLPTNRLGDQDQ